jgi:hypothetical protein
MGPRKLSSPAKRERKGPNRKSDWGDERNEVEVPSSPRCSRNGSPLLPFHGRRRQKLCAAAPGPMEIAFRIQPLEAMGAEEITLGLDEIGCATRLAVTFEIGQRRR